MIPRRVQSNNGSSARRSQWKTCGIKSWNFDRFSVHPHLETRVSVALRLAISNPPPKNNHPPFPLSITDPGYPHRPGQRVSSSSMFRSTRRKSFDHADSTGRPAILTDVARAAVQSWKFMPAMDSGQPVVGMLIVAISFVQPVVTQQPDSSLSSRIRGRCRGGSVSV
jgi:hypothetical protein